MKEHYYKILRDTEKQVRFFIKNQLHDETSMYDGGVLNQYYYCEPKFAINLLSLAIAAYLNKDSSFYRDKNLFNKVKEAVEFVERIQRPDGTFDYMDCNFYAAPDTAFMMTRFIPAYKLLKLLGMDSEDEKLKDKMLEVIKKAGHGMLKGGFHTPNHRWAIAASLMTIYNITGEEELKKAADKYLNEGLDLNEDGEYAERSSGIYNEVNNSQMIILTEETGDKSYLKYVERNLEMMLTYFEPDYTIFTNNSTRQDNDKKMYPIYYYYQYLYIAYHNKNKLFGSVAYEIMNNIIERGDMTQDCLYQFMLYPELIEFELKPMKDVKDYNKFYKDSGIVRVRKGDITYSILKGNTKFLFFQVGELRTFMRIGMSYFAEREFKAQEIKEIEGGYRLTYVAKGWYYKPFAEKPETSDWWKMDNGKRDMITGIDVNITVDVLDKDYGIDVKISTDGCDRVPVKVEFAVEKGSFINTEDFMCIADAGRAITVKHGDISISKGLDALTVGPAFGKHMFIDGKFGSEDRSRSYFSIYFTDFTNFSHTISLKK